VIAYYQNVHTGTYRQAIIR